MGMMVTRSRDVLDELVRDAGAIAHRTGWLTRRVRDCSKRAWVS